MISFFTSSPEFIFCRLFVDGHSDWSKVIPHCSFDLHFSVTNIEHFFMCLLESVPFPSPGDLPNPEIKPTSPALAGGFFTTEPPGKPLGFLGQVRSAVSGSAAKLLISPSLP